MGRAKLIGSPTLTFKAGGNTPSPNKKSNKSTESSANNNNEMPPISPIAMQPTSVVSSAEEENKLLLPSVIQTGIAAKRSPLQIKNWIACVLTLDGRDKFTKVLQYSSRLLCWYFATLAARKLATNGVDAADQLTQSMYSNVELRQQYYTAISKRFEVLYKSLVTSRKAFRIGRSVIEADKIANMGWGNYLSYMLLHPLAGGVAGADTSSCENELEERQESTLSRYDTHPIPEENEDEDDEEASWNEEDEQSDNDNDSLGEEKKEDVPNLSVTKSKKKKVVSRPGRPKLPTKVSSNIGWGPATTSSSPQDASNTEAANIESSKQSTMKPPSRTVSEMGRHMYQAFPSRSSSMGSYKQLKDTPSSLPMTPTQPTTPGWKLIGGTMKLLGLMGFWAFDNVSFLTGSGFLDPIRGNRGGDGDNNTILVDPKASNRLKRKKRASEWAGRCYFAGSIGGLYVNVRSLWEHRNGKLKEAQDMLSKATSEDDIKEAKDHLQKTKKKHFELGLALLKSCCDFMVFSNNPGIDLHMKYRGKKNHEGLHCVCGLVSASTVLYNNFPNSNA